VEPGVRQRASTLAALGAVTVAVFWGGGFDAAPQWAFAGLAVLAAILGPRRRITAPAAVLGALALLAALSAAWTIGTPADALRWSAVALGFSALAAAAVPRAVETIALVAVMTGVLGLVSAGAFSTAFAERLDGGSRPEGPFGYPPALALVQVFALPALLVWAARGRALGAVGLAVAAGVLALDGSRLAVALAVLVCAVAIVAPVAPRPPLVAALALSCLSGLLVHAAVGGWHPRRAEPSGWGLAIVVATVLFSGPVWAALHRRLPSGDSRSLRAPRLALAALVVVAAVGVGIGTAGALDARRFPSHQGFAHGRTWMWNAGLDVAARRPLAGSGSATFLQATILNQPGHGRQTRFAHDLPLELWVELGALGLALGLGLYAACTRVVWRARGTPALWLAGPAVGAFLVSNTVDWTWHLACVGALFALALGALPPPEQVSTRSR
jgi:O-antigen ligase